MDELINMSDADMKSVIDKANLGILQEYKVIDKNNLGGNGSQVLDYTTVQTSCGLCKKLPSGNDTTLILATVRPGAKAIILQGICKDCQPSTRGQSEIKIHYRAYLAQQTGQPHRFLVFQDNEATPYGTPLPRQ